MVNTRILEKRLGWRSGGSGQDSVPPTRSIGHVPLLQGRVTSSRPNAAHRGPHRLAVEEAWQDLPTIADDPAALVDRVGHLPAIGRGSVAAAAMDQLRAQMMRVIRANEWRRIGITSAARGAGRSFVSLGLAASVARLEGVRVLLIDGDLESPGLADALGLRAPAALGETLAGHQPVADVLLRVGDLALALNDTPIAFGAELMLAPDAILALRAMNELLAPDVVLTDMPPLLGDPLAQAMLPQLDAVLLISDGMASTARDIAECERLLEGQVPILGVVLNKSEDRDPRPRGLRRG